MAKKRASGGVIPAVIVAAMGPYTSAGEARAAFEAAGVKVVGARSLRVKAREVPK
ncbi:hypothetical protein L1280_001834 [Deinococcus sp. HSC-46F16]|uniref:hypothetical protein n=1 Tax=Deinococcus sp. HSC-46F16 TaxID=2910968 RepID=UPI00209EBEBF|nr:hypothetical protein [Deinococcus sp. HSC-46F16]MCP2014683.1 hypothetical protein [Deinococcus sp. HSC-46F16]